MGELSDGKVTFLFTDVEGNLLRRGHQLEATGAAPRRLDTALRTRETRPGDLPLQPTALLGRDREVAAALERLLRPEVRLLTLTGPGGTGKTRLGLAVAAELVDRFADGVVLVLLAALSDPELVPAAIAQTLGLREVGGRSLLEGVAGFLRDKQLLLHAGQWPAWTRGTGTRRRRCTRASHCRTSIGRAASTSSCTTAEGADGDTHDRRGGWFAPPVINIPVSRFAVYTI